MKYELRPYQKTAIDDAYEFLQTKDGNPVVIAPTGSGKSLMIAEFCRRALEFEGTKVLVLTHQKELIEQDFAKLKDMAPELDMGIYSASLGEKDASHDITFASIQSIYKQTDLLFDVAIIDECHLINNEDKGMYRSFLGTLGCRVIGFTATPYRLGQGELVADDSLFSAYIESVSIMSLQNMGYLARLRSKGTEAYLSTANVSVRAGEFVQHELDSKVNVYQNNLEVSDEISRSMDAYGRKHCIIFCTSVDHAKNIQSMLNDLGKPCACVTGAMNKKEREENLAEFTSGRACCITSVGILTTGFDYPAVDMLALLRPTMSPGLYMQMMGRGLRVAEGKTDCLVLDFANNVRRHGPVTEVEKPENRRKKSPSGIAPSKECPECLEIVPLSARFCPNCNHEFPRHSPIYELYMGDVNGCGGKEKFVGIKTWVWMERTSKEKGLPMIQITYVSEDGNEKVTEYLCYAHEGYARRKAIQTARELCVGCKVDFDDFLFRDGSVDWYSLWTTLSKKEPPFAVATAPDGKYTRLVGRIWMWQYEKEAHEDLEEQRKANGLRQSLLGR